MSALSAAFPKETDLQTALRMSITIANLAYENDEAYSMIETLDFKPPNIDSLQPAKDE